MRILQRWAVTVLILALGACTSSSPKAKTSASPSPSPSATANLADLTAKEIMDTTLDAARAQGSFRLVSQAKGHGMTATFTNDVTDGRGKQKIDIGTQHAEIIVLDDIAYLRANRAALLNFLGFPASFADKMKDRWVSFTSNDDGFADIAESVTLDSAINDIALHGELSKTKEQTLGGQRVIGIVGLAFDESDATMYVAVAGDHLPVKEAGKSADGTNTIVFSRWGQSVTVEKPPNALPFSELAGTSGGTPA